MRSPVLRFGLALLLSSSMAAMAACSSTSAAGPANDDAGSPGPESTDDGGGGATDAASADATRSCDPYAPRDPTPDLWIGPTGLEKRVLAEIDGAKTSLEIFAYELDRESVIDALIAAKNRGVAVRLVVDKSKSAPAKSTLRAAGIEVKDSPSEQVFQHAKTLIVDGTHALVLSGNLNDYTFTGERNYGVVDTDPFDVADLRAVFERDFAGGGDLDLACTKLVVSPQNSRARLEALIDSAKTSLDLTIMYITDPSALAKLKAKKAAGVAMRVLLADPGWIDSNTATAKELGDAGIEVRFFKSLDLHAKMILADGAAFVGSENLSANSLDNNREIGVIVTNSAVVDAIRTQAGKDWAEGVSP